MKTPDRRTRMEEYRRQCLIHHVLDLIPPDGYCWSCRYDFTDGGTTTPWYGTSGCPKCHTSYCE